MVPRLRGFIRSSATLVPCTKPRYVTSVTLRYSCGPISSKGANTEVNATLIQRSMGPKCCSDRSAAVSTAS